MWPNKLQLASETDRDAVMAALEQIASKALQWLLAFISPEPRCAIGQCSRPGRYGETGILRTMSRNSTACVLRLLKSCPNLVGVLESYHCLL